MIKHQATSSTTPLYTALGTQIVKFGIAGIANTVFGYAVFWLLNQGAGMHIAIANAFSYGCAIALAYVLNRFFVFSGQGPARRSAVLFLLCFAAAFSINQIVLWTLHTLTQLHPGIIQAFAMGSYSIVFFALNRSVVFPARNRD